jgi:hypothetical protein
MAHGVRFWRAGLNVNPLEAMPTSYQAKAWAVEA